MLKHSHSLSSRWDIIAVIPQHNVGDFSVINHFGVMVIYPRPNGFQVKLYYEFGGAECTLV